MKVGILTFPNSTSYGAALQMYALYRAVNKLGHEVEIINYHNEYMKAERHISHGKSTKPIALLKKHTSRMLHNNLYSKFRKFEKKNIFLYPDHALIKKAGLADIGKRYNAVICGSDQVWNPDITDSDLSYFLDFCGDETKRISYAPSFGVESLSDGLFESATKELNQFSAISVREKSGQALVKQMIGIDVPIVVDPTMLISQEEWEELEEKNSKKRGDYILYYTVKGSKHLFDKCREFAKKTGLKMIVIGGNFVKKIKNRDPFVEFAIDISPSEWLSLVHHARYVVTNSFHGTAFSIIFRKDFYLELSAITNSRLTNIVDMFGLGDRVVPKDSPIMPSDADYSKAEEVLSKVQKESLDYLKNALGENL